MPSRILKSEMFHSLTKEGSPISKALSEKEQFIQCLQDGLFFGLEYLRTIFPVEGRFYFSDGDLIFKSQTAFSLNDSPNRNALVSLLSYFSGVYTLALCFSERNFNFPVCAYWTESFKFNEGEKQALLKAGLTLKKAPTKKFLNPKEFSAQSKPSENVFLKVSSSDKNQVRQILENSHQKFELMGDFTPVDWEDFRDFHNIERIYPMCLQGFFPSLAMKPV